MARGVLCHGTPNIHSSRLSHLQNSRIYPNFINGFISSKGLTTCVLRHISGHNFELNLFMRLDYNLFMR